MMRSVTRNSALSSLVAAVLAVSAAPAFAAQHKGHKTDPAPQAQQQVTGEQNSRYTASYSRYMPMDPKDDHVDKAFKQEFYGTGGPDYSYYHGMGTMSMPSQ